MKTLSQCALLAAGAMVLGSMGYESQAAVVFVDNISGYDTTSTRQYVDLNPDARLVKSKDYGGNIAVLNTLGSFSSTPPNQLVNIVSGTAGMHTTLAVNQSSSDRYGQAMVTVGKEALSWLRFSLNDVANPELPGTEAGYVHQGPNVVWHPGAFLKFIDGGTYITGPSYTTSALHNVTLNYDLQSDTFEVWYNNTNVSGTIAFQNPLTTIESMSLGGAYHAGGNNALDYWHWQTSDTTAFTSYGVQIPEPVTLGLLSGVVLLGARRRRARVV